jgi:Helix-turn-helix domain
MYNAPTTFHGTYAVRETDVVAVVHAQAALVLRALRAQPLTSRQTRLLRLILHRFYGKGYCHAAQETLAAAMECSKAAVQADLAELTDRGIIRITKREGTSNFTEVVSGLAEALQTLQAEVQSRRINWRHAAELKAAFETHSTVVFPTKRPKEAKLPVEATPPHKHSTSLIVSKITNTSSCARQPSECERSLDGVAEKVNDDERLRTPVAQGKAMECGTKATTVKATIPEAGVEAQTAALLIGEGVSPSQAWKLVRRFDTAHIERNLALGAHVGKRNPGGYLAEAIRKDFAVASIKPDSEAAQAREHERPTSRATIAVVPLATLAPEVAKTPPEPASAPLTRTEVIDSGTALLDALTEPGKAALRERAIAELDRQNAWMGKVWKHEGVVFEGIVRARMVKLVRGDVGGEERPTEVSASCVKSAVLGNAPLF